MSKESEEITKIMSLLDFCTTVTEIRCDGCNRIDKDYLDEYEAASNFLGKGWEIIKKKCYCSDCILKKNS